jgi:hypothetical protein
MLYLMGMRNELLQTLWEVIAEMERAHLQGDDDQAQRLERIAWRLIGCLKGVCWVSRLQDKKTLKDRAGLKGGRNPPHSR